MMDETDRLKENSDFADQENLQNEEATLLVVEDDEDMLFFISSGLEENYQIIEAVNGQDGLLKAHEYIPDLVVTDLMMPVMDGIELCRQLKTHSETSHIPVIMLTAKKSLESQIEGLETGADDYITKPFHMVLLEARIKNLLRIRQLLREQYSKPFMTGQQRSFTGSPLDQEFMSRVLKAVQKNYSDWEFKSEELASLLNMSARTLQRKLKAVTGQTPSGFINEYRMVQAAELLQKTDASITDIAFQVGYDESSHFTRMFKKVYDVSPSQYRTDHLSS